MFSVYRYLWGTLLDRYNPWQDAAWAMKSASERYINPLVEPVTNAGTIAGGDVFRPVYSFSVIDSDEYDIKTNYSDPADSIDISYQYHQIAASHAIHEFFKNDFRS